MAVTPSRRDFVCAAGCAVAATAAGACASTEPTLGGPGGPPVAGTFRVALPAVGATAAIPNAGAGGQGIAVTRLTDTSVVAVSRQCTHQHCTLRLPSASGAPLSCDCHGSQFTTSGAVVQGPAVASLPTYPATIDTATNEAVVTVP